MLFIVKWAEIKLYIFSFDSLTIYDGGSNTSPMLGNPYCGDSLPPSQISSSNYLFIHFLSNNAFTGTGFKLEYNATSKNTCKIHISPPHVMIICCTLKDADMNSKLLDNFSYDLIEALVKYFFEFLPTLLPQTT